jgi:hypothetical protein
MEYAYHYKTLESVLNNIASDFSDENIQKQITRLTSDELRKLKDLLTLVKDAEGNA